VGGGGVTSLDQGSCLYAHRVHVSAAVQKIQDKDGYIYIYNIIYIYICIYIGTRRRMEETGRITRVGRWWCGTVTV